MNIYYKIYKLYRKNIPAQQISVSTNIPLKMIKDIIARFEAKGEINDADEAHKAVELFLDFIVSKFHKHAILDFSGTLTGKFSDKIKEALSAAKKMPWQALGVKLESVLEIDDAAMKMILKFGEQMKEIGKTIIFLSPSEPVEEYIQANKVEESFLVFGTQNAFEDHVFKNVASGIASKSNNLAK